MAPYFSDGSASPHFIHLFLDTKKFLQFRLDAGVRNCDNRKWKNPEAGTSGSFRVQCWCPQITSGRWCQPPRLTSTHRKQIHPRKDGPVSIAPTRIFKDSRTRMMVIYLDNPVKMNDRQLSHFSSSFFAITFRAKERSS